MLTVTFLVEMHVLEVQVRHETAIFHFDALHFDARRDEDLSRLVMLSLLDAFCVKGAYVEWFAGHVPAQEAWPSILILLCRISPRVDSAALA